MKPPRFEARGHGDHAARYYLAHRLITEELALIRALYEAHSGTTVEQSHDFPVDNQMSTVTAHVPNDASWRVEVRPHDARQHTVYTPTDDGHILIHTCENDRVVSSHQTAADSSGSDRLEGLHAILFDFSDAAAEA